MNLQPSTLNSQFSTLLGAAVLGLGVAAWAQDALRVSLAGQEAAEARKRVLANEKFNLKLGPVGLRFQGQLGLEAIDNVRATASDEAADLIFRPQISALSVWRVSQKNSLNFSLGLGYTKYLHTTEFDHLFVSPGSDLGFDIYVGDFAINLHDRFSYSQDVSADPTASGVGSLSRVENTSGLLVTWDLNQVVLTLGYDHDIYVATESDFSYLTHAQELFSASAGFRVHPKALAGIEIGGGLTDYDENVFQDSAHVAAGPFALVRFSQYTTLRLSAGYVLYFIDTTGLTNATDTLDAVYGGLSLQQRGRGVSHSLSAGRQVQTGLLGNSLVDLIYLRHEAEWRLFRKTGLRTSLAYEHVDESGGTSETLDRYGAGLTLSRALTRHASASLRYQLYLKNSNVKSREYVQNQLVLNVVYTF